MARSRSGEKNEEKKGTRNDSEEHVQLASEEEKKPQEKVFFSEAGFCLLDSLLPGEKLEGFVSTGIDLVNKNIRTFSSQDLLDCYCIFVFIPNNFTDATNLVSFLRELILQFQEESPLDFKVFTVSTDSVESNLAWIDLNWSSDIPIPLNMLSDTNGDLCRKFGVFDVETHRAYTSVFLIDKDGIVQGSTVCGHNGIFASSVDCLMNMVNSMNI